MNRSRTLTPIVLAITSCCLGGVLIYEITSPVVPYRAAKVGPREPIMTLAKNKRYVPPHLDGFAIIDDGFVFNPRRIAFRISGTSVDEGTRGHSPPRFNLIGVIIDGHSRIAVTKAEGATTAVDLLLGQNIGDWEVSAIESDRVVLRAGTNNFDVKLQSPSVALSGTNSVRGKQSIQRAPSGLGSKNP